MESKRLKTPGRMKTPSAKNSFEKDPVEVFCRIKPTSNPVGDENIIKLSDTVIQFKPPCTSYASRNGVQKICNFTFSGVYGPESDQNTVFKRLCVPLLEGFLGGKNGIVFTYGVTGSGKTYTMTGNDDDPGLLPRALDVVFNSIDNQQTRRYVITPDRMNGFEIQSEADALLKRQKDLEFGKAALFKKSENSNRMVEKTSLDIGDRNVRYAVFVTYTEIYNNFAYDLLEDYTEKTIRKAKQSKILREDSRHNMYVFGVTEVEVKSTEEALSLFHRGQRKRRVGNTALNAESSRSHSIFTIRLVQVPLDCCHEPVQNPDYLLISQLCLVDLAGSERTVRARTAGDRLKEAGNINSSLMSLRTCIEILRENQMNGTFKMVPYRDSKLTMLFKSYFEYGGSIKMIVCIDPSSDSYDETLQVMKFAELTKEVQVIKPHAPEIIEDEAPPAKRRLFEFQTPQFKTQSMKSKGLLSKSTSLIIPKLPPNFIEMLKQDNENFDTLLKFTKILERQKMWHERHLKKLQSNSIEFRSALVSREENMTLINQQYVDKCSEIEYKNKIIENLEEDLVSQQVKTDEIEQQLEYFERNAKDLERAVEEKDMILTQRKILEQKERYKLKLHYQSMAQRKKKEFEAVVQKRIKDHERDYVMQAEKLRKVKELLQDVPGQSKCHVACGSEGCNCNVRNKTSCKSGVYCTPGGQVYI